MAPDIERLDLEYLYETMREEFGLVESQGWPVETLRNLVPHPTLPDELPSLNSLIDVEVASLQGVPTVAITSRQRFEGKFTLERRSSSCSRRAFGPASRSRRSRSNR